MENPPKTEYPWRANFPLEGGVEGPPETQIPQGGRVSPGRERRALALTVRVVQQGFGQIRQEALRRVITLTDSEGLCGWKVE